MLKIKERVGKFKGSFSKKTIRQKIWFCIALTLVLVFLFFIIKGNTYDLWKSSAAQTQKTEEYSEISDSVVSEEKTDSAESSDKPQKTMPKFNISRLDVGIMIALFGAYGIHKYREKKRERR